MFDSEQIKTWVQDIQKEIWNSFEDSATDLLEDVCIRASASLAKIRGSVWANPKTSSMLASALAGETNFKDDESKTDSQISSSRTLHVDYAGIVEDGGETLVPSGAKGEALAKKFYFIYKTYGDKKYKYLFLIVKLGLRGTFKHLAHPYISPAIDSTNEEILNMYISDNLEYRLSKIPNIEVKFVY